MKKIETSEKCRKKKRNKTDTYKIPRILVGPGINQQPHAVLITIRSGTHQRRAFTLREQGTTTIPHKR
jgi:hypothetical protein